MILSLRKHPGNNFPVAPFDLLTSCLSRYYYSFKFVRFFPPVLIYSQTRPESFVSDENCVFHFNFIFSLVKARSISSGLFSRTRFTNTALLLVFFGYFFFFEEEKKIRN